MLGYAWNEADRLAAGVRARAAPGGRGPALRRPRPARRPARTGSPSPSPRRRRHPGDAAALRPRAGRRRRGRGPRLDRSRGRRVPRRRSACGPGVGSRSREKHPFDGPLVLRVDGHDRTLGERVARQIYVDPHQYDGGAAERQRRRIGQARRQKEDRLTSLFAAEGGYQEFTLAGGEWFDPHRLGAHRAARPRRRLRALMRGVLAADQGTPEDAARSPLAIQEGALAYLARQFRRSPSSSCPLVVVVFVTSTAV